MGRRAPLEQAHRIRHRVRSSRIDTLRPRDHPAEYPDGAPRNGGEALRTIRRCGRSRGTAGRRSVMETERQRYAERAVRNRASGGAGTLLSLARFTARCRRLHRRLGTSGPAAARFVGASRNSALEHARYCMRHGGPCPDRSQQDVTIKSDWLPSGRIHQSASHQQLPLRYRRNERPGRTSWPGS
jgi:hypothetical protein